MTVSSEDVRAAYRFILGREPESEEVVRRHQRSVDFDALRFAFFSSTEFNNKTTVHPSRLLVPLTAIPQEIETAAEPTNITECINKVTAKWEAAGDVAPYYSVLTQEKYKPANFVQHQDAFFDSGKAELDLLLAILKRIGRTPADFHRCAEFGCGVGRTTAQLASTFPEVVALDISASHLHLARAHLTNLGYDNVAYFQVSADDFHPGADFDLWFSRLVLQHNPPPVTLAILDKMFSKLRAKGVAVVHVPTYQSGYRFTITDYLKENLPKEHMNMHATPQKDILDLAWKHGCCLVDVREEPILGWVSNIFAFEKK